LLESNLTSGIDPVESANYAGMYAYSGQSASIFDHLRQLSFRARQCILSFPAELASVRSADEPEDLSMDRAFRSHAVENLRLAICGIASGVNPRQVRQAGHASTRGEK
jgi:hypothetical protein